MKTKMYMLSVACCALITGIWSLTSEMTVNKKATEQLILNNIEALTNNNDEGKSEWEMSDGTPLPIFQCGGVLSNGSPCTFNVMECAGGGSGCTPRKCGLHG